MTILDIRPSEDAEKVMDAVDSFAANHKNSGVGVINEKTALIFTYRSLRI